MNLATLAIGKYQLKLRYEGVFTLNLEDGEEIVLSEKEMERMITEWLGANMDMSEHEND